MSRSPYAYIRPLVCTAGAILFILAGLFPPWQVATPSVTVRGMSVPERTKFAGYHFISEPPDPTDSAYAGDLLNEVMAGPQGATSTSVPRKSIFDQLQSVEANDKLPKLTRVARLDLPRLVVEGVTILVPTLLLAWAFPPQLRSRVA
jgi:hypothetical protein